MKSENPIHNYFENFTAADLAQNELFISLVRNESPERLAYWNEVFYEYPHLIEEAGIAREILLIGAVPAEGVMVADILNTVALRTGVNPKTAKVVKFSFTWQYAAAAAVVLAMFGSWLAYNTFSVSDSALLQVSVRTANERSVINLPDGSVVSLNKNSELKYYKNWAEGVKREVWINGEAYFAVTPKRFNNEPVKFVVHAEHLDAAVKGTRFNVRTSDNKSEIVLEEGKVEVSLPEENKPLYALAPGDKVEFDNKLHTVKKRPVETRFYTCWKDNSLKLDNARIGDLTEMIERNNGTKIIFTDTSLYNRRISGPIDLTNMDDLTRVICRITNTRSEKRDKDLYILN
ncbi:MAG: FecR domain-containing protein [Bacteroidota bacterium]